MIELQAKQFNPQQGEVTVVIRFKGIILYMKTQKDAQKNSMIEQLRKGGADILESERGWLRINMFKEHKVAKFGELIVDTEEMSPEEVETILINFYKTKYEEAKFDVKIKRL